MRLTLFDAGDRSTVELAEALGAEGFAVDRRAMAVSDGPEATATLVATLRAAEAELADQPPDAVLVAGGGDAALAATLVAVKLEIPTAWLPAAGPDDPLPGLVADLTLDASGDASASAQAVGAMAGPTLPSP
jgi:hypothetical protein